MKIRNGFVSNSSSASFVIRWMWPDNNIQNFTLEDAKKKIINYHQDDIDKFKKEKNKDNSVDLSNMTMVSNPYTGSISLYAAIEDLLDNHTKDKNIFYETSVFTIMYNDATSFGPATATLLMELMLHGFRVDTEIKDDH